ncbi:hypothetical protein [Bacillus sp. J37]|uniref:aggregation-promoting factor C-terminal-like domain-containing protein n=1 Tax=Bacillus sp. J37 TaxID=935837 RepID=UPI000478A83E|nr:hypothetical protein [Bacillus sp. J37]
MATPYTSKQVDQDMRFINQYSKLGNKANDKQNDHYSYLKSKYGNNTLKSGVFRPEDLSSSNQKQYVSQNPYGNFAKNQQSSYFNTVDNAIKNNQAVSDKQMNYYNEYAKKWNLTPQSQRPMSFEEATQQASKQVDPLYKQALMDIQSQQFNNTREAQQNAQSMGLENSGLAQDQQMRIAMASQAQRGQLGSERATQIAEMAQGLVQSDTDRKDRLNQQSLEEQWRQKQFDYQQQRDKVSDSQWSKDYEWRQYVFNNMSASEKAQLEWAKSQYGEDTAWRMFELKYNGELQKSMNDSQIEFYKSGFNNVQEGGGYSNYKKTSTQASKSSSYKTYQTHLNQAIKMGVPASWAAPLTELVGRESSWNSSAKNPKSTAHGYGQFLNSTRRNYEKKTGLDYSNPVHQLVMMAEYVKDRYGTPEKALAFWDKNNWY